VPLPTLLLQLLLLKLHVLLPTALVKPLLPHKALQIKHCLLLRKLRLAARQTAKAWNVCSRNRCPSNACYWQHLFERRACRGVFLDNYPNRFRNTIRALDQRLDDIPVELTCFFRCNGNELLGNIGQWILAERFNTR